MNADPEETLYVLDCPGCDLETLVDEAVRRDILSVGCYLCGSDVTPGHFEPAVEGGIEAE
ncbi:MAG: DUF7560 family zinc ribbon protein [Halodesulfurarchaeum sp.]